MFLELHILQNFAPSNLNRDDTGSPKDCEFGGHRRARISSQCLKRAIRRDSNFADLLAERGGLRTRRLILEIARRVAKQDRPPDNVVKIVADVFKKGGIERSTTQRGQKQVEEDTTKLILFVSKPAIDDMARAFETRWDALTRGDDDAKGAAVDELGQALVRSMKAPDIALFGRMIEIDPSTPFGKLQLRLDAACQVAHAISTNKVSMEFDFYTAVDEIPGPDAGAGMVSAVEFNSACFYRYANVDLAQLAQNLDGDEALARQTLEAFLRASVAAVPTGKQNSMAAHNPPSFILAVLRHWGLWNLANAFVRPVRPTQDRDLVQGSIAALDRYWGQLAALYGEGGIVGKWFATLDPDGVEHLGPVPSPTFETLVTSVLANARFDRTAGGGKA